MNIDYAAIIEKANKRKDALQAFESACHHLDDVFRNELMAINAACAEFKRAADALDAEAQALLPQGAAHPMQRLAYDLMWTINRLGQKYDAGGMTPAEGLAKLVAS